MILAIIKMNALPAKRKELLQTFQALIQPLRKEKGCLHCSVYLDIENKNAFCMIEEWATQEDLDNYLRSDLFSVLLGAKNLLRASPEIIFNTVSDISGMEAVKAAQGREV